MRVGYPHGENLVPTRSAFWLLFNGHTANSPFSVIEHRQRHSQFLEHFRGTRRGRYGERPIACDRSKGYRLSRFRRRGGCMVLT